MIKAELLYFEGCPHVDPALGLLEEVLDALAPGTTISRVVVADPEDACKRGFLGSPSIRINGDDLEGRQPGAEGGTLGCRLYGSSGVPPRWMIEAAVLRALGPRSVLFLCVANSARSQMAEGIARSLAAQDISVASAGSAPSRVRPEAIAVLNEIGVDIAAHHSKSVDGTDPAAVDAVITLCAEEVCPVFLGQAHQVHWPLADPAAEEGGAQQRLDAFRRARDELRRKLGLLFLG